jgi:hypothetical protein
MREAWELAGTPAYLRSDHDGLERVIMMRWNSRSPYGGITGHA